jgi:hypothetical protein
MDLNVFAIQFINVNTIRLVLAPKDIRKLTEKVITSLYSLLNIEKTKEHINFVFDGDPLKTTEDTSFEYLICMLLKNYLEHGWHLEATMCLNRYGENGSTIIFKNRETERKETFIACLSLDSTNQLNIIGLKDITSKVRVEIKNCWPQGIKDEFDTSAGSQITYQFTLKGSPWEPKTKEERYHNPNLIRAVLNSLYSIGWVYLGAISTYEFKLNKLYFKFTPDKVSPGSMMFALRLSGPESLTIINTNPFLQDMIRSLIKSTWKHGIKEEKPVYNSYKFKLKGDPWLAKSNDAIDSNRLINKLIEMLKQNGHDLYSICDTTSQYGRLSTLFFQKTSAELSISRVLSLSFHGTSLIRVVDDVSEFARLLRSYIASGWPKGINEEAVVNSSIQFRLNGDPFSSETAAVASSADHVKDEFTILVVVMSLIDSINGYGFFYIGNADLNCKVIREQRSRTRWDVRDKCIHTLLFQYKPQISVAQTN